MTDYRMTDRTKTICPPIFDLRGIKTPKVSVVSFGQEMGEGGIYNFILFFPIGATYQN